MCVCVCVFACMCLCSCVSVCAWVCIHLWSSCTSLTFSTLQAHCVAEPIISLASAGALCRPAKGVHNSRFVYFISVARLNWALLSAICICFDSVQDSKCLKSKINLEDFCKPKMLEADLGTLLHEVFFDPNSEDEFEGFTQADIDGEVVARVDEDNECVSNDSDSESERESDSSIPSGYQHQWLTNFSETSGPKEIPDGISEGQLFVLFMTDEIISKLVTETNRYASHVKEKRGRYVGPHSYISSWKDISFDKMKAFLAILLLIGLTKRPSFDLYCRARNSSWKRGISRKWKSKIVEKFSTEKQIDKHTFFCIKQPVGVEESMEITTWILLLRSMWWPC